MTNLVVDTVQQLLPKRKKGGTTGWTSFNAVCCHHKGESKDTRGRGGIRFDDDGFAYHCFNCGFKAGWRPGSLLSKNTKSLLAWLNATDDQTAQIGFEVLRLRESLPVPKKFQVQSTEFVTVDLPVGARPLTEVLSDNPPDDALAVAEYILNRKLDPTKYYWSGDEGLGRRFIIPFEYDGRVVGWTARTIDNVKITKYLSHTPGGFVYGLSKQDDSQQYVFVVEGVLDADVIDACALLHAEVNPTQRQQIAELDLSTVLVPDRDKTGLKLAEQVLEYGWSVSLPTWHDDVKDVADAVRRYGVPYTMASIVQGIETNSLKAKLKIRTLQNKLLDKVQ
jgi:hypothetical protein